MTKCYFEIHGVDHNGERKLISQTENIITYEGLMLLAGANKNATANMPEGFNSMVTAMFVGSGTRPTSISDSGLEALEFILPSRNAFNSSGTIDIYETMDICLPIGTYTELAVGSHDPVGGVSKYFNRSLLETPLVIDDAFINTWRAVSFNYKFGVIGNTSLPRKSMININGVDYTASISSKEISPWNEYFGTLSGIEGYRGGAIAGSIYGNQLTTTITRLSPTPDNVAVYEVVMKNNTTGNVNLEWVRYRTGGILNTAFITNELNPEQPLVIAPTETVTLQFETVLLSNYGTELKVSQSDLGIGTVQEWAYNLSTTSFNLHPYSLKSAYRIDVESDVRTDYTPQQVKSYDTIEGFVPEVERAGNPNYIRPYNDSARIVGDNTSIYRMFYKNFGNAEYFVKAAIGPTAGSYTFNFPVVAYNAAILNSGNSTTAPGYILSSKPSNADQVVFYDAYLNKIVRVNVFKTSTNQDAIHFPTEMLKHMTGNVVAMKYGNSANTTLKGVWRTYNLSSNPDHTENFAGTADISAVTTLVRSSVSTTPIIAFNYNRTTKRLSGYVINASKIRILGQGDNTEVYEFDVTPNKEFDIDLSALEMSVSVNYKFCAWNETTGDSDGYIYNGFTSIAVPAITDAVYNAATLKINFTRPAAYIKYAILCRWDFEFYRIELTDGANVLNLTSALEENGQWELIAVDEAGGKSAPFYIFGEKPDDIAVKPSNSTPVITPTALNTNQTYRTGNIGYYIDPLAARKWWEGLQWFGSIDDVPATVTFLGVVARNPYVEGQSYPTHVPFLSFNITAGNISFDFELSAIQTGSNAGTWNSRSSIYSNRCTIKLWSDWYQYDGINNSEVYWSQRQPTNSVFGTGNGYHQFTEIQSGYIRRGLGIILNAADEMVYGGSCPINFDDELTAAGITLPATYSRMPYMHVVLGNAVYQNGNTGVIRKDQLKDYTVLINNKLATATVIEDVEGATTNDYCKAITWENEDGVAYRHDLATWNFIRTDRNDHAGDPDFINITDTIQLCYNWRANPTWQNHWVFQSGTNYERNFDSNIRQLSYGSYWQSIKGWIRPYYKPNQDLILGQSELENFSGSYQLLDFSIDASLLDAGNSIVYSINGEPATLVEPTAPQQYLSWGKEGSYEPEKEATVLNAVDVGVSLYKNKYMQPVGSNYTYNLSEYTTLLREDWYNMTYYERFLINPNKTAYERYRNALPNAEEYLTHDELMSILYQNKNDYNGYMVNFWIDIRLATPEMLAKKLLVPVYVSYNYRADIQYQITNGITEATVGTAQNVYTVTMADYLTGLHNPGLADTSKSINCEWAEITIGHREYPLSAAVIKGYSSFKLVEHNGNATDRISTIYIVDSDGTISNDTHYLVGDQFGFYPRQQDLEFGIYHTISCSNVDVGRTLSVALFGEDRGYQTFTDAGVFKAGVFNVKRARDLGYTGKFLIAVIAQNRTIGYANMLVNGNDENWQFTQWPRDEVVANLRPLFEGKPTTGNWTIMDYIEIDLSKTDEELALIESKFYHMFINDMPTIARMCVSVNGFIPPVVYPEGDLGTNYYKNEPYKAPNLGGAYLIETSDPKLMRRKIVSENYTIEEAPIYGKPVVLTRNKGLWQITRGWEIDNKDTTPDYWKPVKLLVTTTKFNSMNIFSSSNTPAYTVQSGDDLGHYLHVSNSIHAFESPSYTPQQADPRKWPRSYGYQDNMSGFATTLCRMAMYLTTMYPYSDISSFLVVSCNDKLVRVEVNRNAGVVSYANWPASQYLNDVQFLRLVDDVTDEVIANIYLSITGYSNAYGRFELLLTEPGTYLFGLLYDSMESILMNIMSNLGYAKKFYEGNYAMAAYMSVYDYSNPPSLLPVNISDYYGIDSSMSIGEFGETGNSRRIPYPNYQLVQTTEDFLANFNVYVNGELVNSITSETLIDGGINAIKYTIDSSILTFALYFNIDAEGGYRGEIITIKDNSHEFFVIGYESIKTMIMDTSNEHAVYAFSRWFSDDSLDFYGGNDQSDTPRWLLTGRVYYTASNDNAFYKPTAVLVMDNNNYVDESEAIRNGWLDAINTSYSAFNNDSLNNSTEITDEELFDSDNDSSLIPVFFGKMGTYFTNGRPELNSNMMFKEEGGYVYSFDSGQLYLSLDVNYSMVVPEGEEGTEPSEIFPKVMHDISSTRNNIMNLFLNIGYVDINTAVLNDGPTGPGPIGPIGGGEIIVAMSEIPVEEPDGEIPVEEPGGIPVSPLAGIYIGDAGAEYDVDGRLQYHKFVDGEYATRTSYPYNFFKEETITNAYSGETAKILHYATLNTSANLYAINKIPSILADKTASDPKILAWHPSNNMYRGEGPYRELKAFTASGVELRDPTIRRSFDGNSGDIDIYFENENQERFYQHTAEVYDGMISYSSRSSDLTYITEPYFDIFYATRWVEEYENPVFRDVTGAEVPYDSLITYVNNMPNFHVHRETKETDYGDGPVTIYRWFVWQRILNERFVPILDRSITDHVTWADNLAATGLGIDIRTIPLDNADRIGAASNFPCPNLNVIYAEYPEGTPFGTALSDIDATLINRIFHMSIDGVAGVFENVVYSDDPGTISFDWVHPSLTVSYMIDGFQVNLENNKWNYLMFSSITTHAEFAEGVNVANVYCRLNVWTRGYPSDDAWAPYPYIMSGTTEATMAYMGVVSIINYSDPLYVETGVEVAYVINETRTPVIKEGNWSELYKEVKFDGEPTGPEQPIEV